jgi:hypothetical protein
MIFVAMYNPPLKVGIPILLGTITSVCNHGLTNSVAKWADRILMIKTFFIISLTIATARVYTFYKVYLLFALSTSGIVYFISKFRSRKQPIIPAAQATICLRSNYMHLYCHTSVTLVNTCLMMLLSGTDCFNWILVFYTFVIMCIGISIYQELGKFQMNPKLLLLQSGTNKCDNAIYSTKR